MSTEWLAGHISQLIGLTPDEVKSQVIPPLQDISSRPRLERHLHDLCGTSTAANDFIQAYVDSRFPPPPRSKSKPVTRTVQSGKSGSTTTLVRNSNVPTNTKGRRGGGAITPEILTPSGSSTNLVDAFGGGGHVYMKNELRDEDLGWGGSGKGKGKASGAKSTPEASSDPYHPSTSKTIGNLALDLNSSGRAGPSTHSTQTRTLDPAAILAKNRQAEQAAEALKSSEVKKMEKTIARVAAFEVGSAGENLYTGPGYEGCFCLARLHHESRYTPLCMACGLVVCELQQPYAPCPSCGSSLLNGAIKNRALGKLEVDLAALVAREKAEKLKLEEERRQEWLAQNGGGQFPMLSGAAGDSKGAAGTLTGAKQPPVATSRTVISLGPSKTAHRSVATKITYTKAPPPPAAAPAGGSSEAKSQSRVGVVKVPRPVGTPGNPAEGRRVIRAVEYVPLVRPDEGNAAEEGGGGGAGGRRRKKGSGK